MLKRLVLFLSYILEKPLPPGTIVNGRYNVISLLGTGGYGHTYHVIDEETGKHMALKALRLHKRISRKGRAGFDREKEFLQELNTEGIPDYFGSGEHEGTPYYVMELVKGKNFEQAIFEDGKSFQEDEAFKIAFEVLTILDSLHQQGIVHRDVRIPNVILSGEKIYLLDLGLAESASYGKKRNLFTRIHPRKERNQQADFYGLGHFVLFLLYSSYSPIPGQKERSWEEELNLSPLAKSILKKLLKLDGEYTSCTEVQSEIKQLLVEGEKKNVNI
ncbi:hypothetical protein A8F94_02830 [Bacillus sp. FJAT-27225]|uniref:serine/threonine-protein kinase n=1 Tax=Bacillus sp. FJAT-27225 TaxID=1743144 RepID=UPI00080C2FF0|nr:protein kinase [Bacillus sp. FJAT-27225]OCA90825.1 hypothetical protein A8F94_02830 [Bacillus sp. FJAT-27225]